MTAAPDPATAADHVPGFSWVVRARVVQRTCGLGRDHLLTIDAPADLQPPYRGDGLSPQHGILPGWIVDTAFPGHAGDLVELTVVIRKVAA